MNRGLKITKIGKKDFPAFYKLNNRLWLQRLANDITDTLIFVDHPHIVIVGTKGKEKEITIPSAMARREDIPLCRVDWEGEITYRGPGQLIIYPVIHTYRQGLTMDDINGKLENVLIQVLQQYGMKAHSLPDGRGVGVNGSKIAYIDMEIRQKVTRFSLALNINPRLSLLRMLQLDLDNTEGVTSMYSIIKKKLDVELLKMRFISHFQKEFGYKIDCASSF